MNQVNDFIDAFAQRLRPEITKTSGQRRIGDAANVFTLIYSIPLALLGVVWLIKITDLKVISDNWQLLLLFTALMFIFDRLNYFLIIEIRTGGFANTEGDLDTIVMWAGIFILGVEAIWIAVLLATIYFIYGYQRARSSSNRWHLWRVYISSIAVSIISTLSALWIFNQMGGSLPLPGYSVDIILPAMLAFAVQFAMSIALVSGYFVYVAWALKTYLDASIRPFTIFFITAFALPALANPFSILVAGLFIQEGLLSYLFFIAGLLMVALLARRLSMTAEYSRQQSRQLEELEKLGRALLNAPPDGSTLGEILSQNVPAMFAANGIFIQLESGQVLLSHPQDLELDWQHTWDWLQYQRSAQVFAPNDKLPWHSSTDPHSALVLTPIMDASKDTPLGGIYLELLSSSLPWDEKSISNLIPAVKSLSDQIASSLNRTMVYRETLQVQRTIQEISLARRIQASFLPESVPDYPGWQLAATLEPARQISGDFYDFIPLPNGRLAIIIADVADKGLGPALYMALSRTLIRTFATQFEAQPAEVLNAANQRIIHDARANLFVTVFYGILDLYSGELIYANAGHTPPYLLETRNRGAYTTLKNTGMPLGIEEDSIWSQEETIISPGDILLLYTDGITDAQNENGEFIDRKAILDIAQRNIELSIPDLERAILNEVHAFVGSAPRFDDITLVIVGREDKGILL